MPGDRSRIAYIAAVHYYSGLRHVLAALVVGPLRQHGDNGWQLALLAMYLAIRPIAGTSCSWPACHVADAQVIVSADCRRPCVTMALVAPPTASVASHHDRCKRQCGRR